MYGVSALAGWAVPVSGVSGIPNAMGIACVFPAEAGTPHLISLRPTCSRDLVTHSLWDFGRGELRFTSTRVVNPAQHLKAVK